MDPGPRLMEVDRPDADRSAIAREYRCQWLVELWVQKHPPRFSIPGRTDCSSRREVGKGALSEASRSHNASVSPRACTCSR